MKPVVAICIPSGRTWEAEMAVALISILGPSGCDITVHNRQGSQISAQRNELVDLALADADVTHLFWVDSDIVLPPTALRELLDHDKEIVGATYCKKTPPYEMTGRLHRTEGRLKVAELLPGGCLLVKASIYRSLSWPWYFETAYTESRTTTSEDYKFCERVRKEGYEIWCDLDLSQRIGHIGSQTVRLSLPKE